MLNILIRARVDAKRAASFACEAALGIFKSSKKTEDGRVTKEDKPINLASSLISLIRSWASHNRPGIRLHGLLQ